MDVKCCFIVRKTLNLRDSIEPQIKRLQRLIYMSAIPMNDDAKIHFFPDMAKIIFSFQRKSVSLQKNIVIMTQSQMKETGIFSGVNLSIFSEEEKTILNLFARKYWKVTRAERIS